jgi:hypothetical protein
LNVSGITSLGTTNTGTLVSSNSIGVSADAVTGGTIVLKPSTGENNISLGNSNSTGSTSTTYDNVIIGNKCADTAVLTGNNNTIVGNYNCELITSGTRNCLMGSNCCNLLAGGSYNISVGSGCYPNLTSANGNSAIGDSAGTGVTTGASNTFLGSNTSSSGGAFTRGTAIGVDAVIGGSNQIVLGTATENVYVAGSNFRVFNNLLIQSDATTAYIRPTNASTTLYLGTVATNYFSINSVGTTSVERQGTNIDTTFNVISGSATTAGAYTNRSVINFNVLGQAGSMTNNLIIAKYINPNYGFEFYGNNTLIASLETAVGLIMNGDTKITLGSGATNPTTGTQLGGSTKTVIASVILTTSLAQYATFTPPNAGTYLITTNFLLTYGGAGATAGIVQYFWGTNSASTTSLIIGTNIIGYIPATATASSSISLPSQCIIYQTPATPVAIYLNAVATGTTVLPTISSGNCYYQYTRIA